MILRMLETPQLLRIVVWTSVGFTGICASNPQKHNGFSDASKTIDFTGDVAAAMSRMHDKTIVVVHLQTQNINCVKGVY